MQVSAFDLGSKWGSFELVRESFHFPFELRPESIIGKKRRIENESINDKENGDEAMILLQEALKMIEKAGSLNPKYQHIAIQLEKSINGEIPKSIEDKIDLVLKKLELKSNPKSNSNPKSYDEVTKSKGKSNSNPVPKSIPISIPNPTRNPNSNSIPKSNPKSTLKSISKPIPKSVPKPIPIPNTPKNQFVLIVDKNSIQPELDSKKLRNELDSELQKRGGKGPIVTKITRSFKNNIVITVMNPNQINLLELNKDVIYNVFRNYSIRNHEIPNSWIKLIAHNIPVNSIQNFKSEVKTYNGIDTIGEPRWLIQPKNSAGSVIFAVKNEIDEKRCLRGLIFEGIDVKIVKFRSFSPKSQCFKCQGFGHDPKTCKNKKSCKFCGKNHFTKDHVCLSCKSSGKCIHLIPKCVNCGQNHIADDPICETIREIRSL